MNTNDLKKLIGTDCLVIDPRSKKKVFEPATIRAVNVNYSLLESYNTIHEHISYEVVLHKVSIRKKGFFTTYNRQFYVSGNRIQIPS